MPEEDFHKKPTLSGLSEDRKIVPAPDDIVPKMIGPYKIESLLEKGGMSLLYLGIHPVTKEPTTIKVLLPKFLSHPDVVKRFLNEAEIIALTDHPNIIKLYGHGEWEGGLYIAMEFVQGISLRQALLQSPISLKRSLEIIIDIAYALCHLHTHGVIHRDLKPENILITEEGQIKVIDFGIAQLLTEKSQTGLPAKQRLIGTPIYMSPEQREDPETVSYPSDIYSLGIITYELALGKLSHGQIHLSLMPKGLQKILNKALQPNPKDRYHDIVDFITDVSAYLNSTNLEKEKKVGDMVSELSENLRTAQGMLLAPLPTDWKEMELGFVNHKGMNLYGMYCDFFSLPDDRYGILIAESFAKGAEGVIYTSILRGLVHALKSQAAKPVELATALNQLLVNDNIGQPFALGYIVLSSKENSLSYLSCGYGNLWRIAKDSSTPIKIGKNNIAIGIDTEIEFSETTVPWEINDILLLNSFAAGVTDHPTENEFSDDFFEKAFQENANISPQKMVEAILRKAKLTFPKSLHERILTLISIFRSQ